MGSRGRDRKILTYPSRESETPINVLARTLEKSSGGVVSGVLVAIEWDDGSVSVDYSSMTMSRLSWLETNARILIDQHLIEGIEYGDDEDDDEEEGDGDAAS